MTANDKLIADWMDIDTSFIEVDFYHDEDANALLQEHLAEHGFALQKSKALFPNSGWRCFVSGPDGFISTVDNRDRKEAVCNAALALINKFFDSIKTEPS